MRSIFETLEGRYAFFLLGWTAARQVLGPAHPERTLYDWTFRKIPLQIMVSR